MRAIVLSRVEAREFDRLATRLLGLPRAPSRRLRGVRTMSAGTTTRLDTPIKHPTRDAYAYPLSRKLLRYLRSASLRKRLTAAELGWIEARLRLAADLGADWALPDAEGSPDYRLEIP